jgi:evolved beta-galactosidase subunit beta
MIVIESLALFERVCREGKKWQRCREAIANAERIPPNQYHSVGDSLVYRLFEGRAQAEACFTGQRRYFDVHYYFSGEEQIEFADKASLTVLTPYDDRSDQETFEGRGQRIVARAGQVLIYENTEAVRLVEAEPVRKVILKVTIEGGYFKNK